MAFFRRTIWLSCQWTDINEILYLNGFTKYIEKTQFSLKSEKNDGYFTWRPIYIFGHIWLNLSYNEKILDTSCREN